MDDSTEQAEPLREAHPVVVVDSLPARVRRALDLVRLTGLVVVVVVLAGLGSIANNTTIGANDDLARLLDEVPHVFVHALSLLGAFGALALPVAFVVREIVRGQPRRLIEALLTGLLAIGVVGGLDLAISAFGSSGLHDALTLVGPQETVRPLDAYLAALFAFVVVIGVAGEPLWRTLFTAVIGVYVVSAFAAVQASLLSLLLSPAIGAVVGLTVRYVAGSANERPGAHRVADELRRRGLHIVGIERVHAEDDDHRSYVATTAAGEHLTVHVFDRDLIAFGAVYSLYRLIRVRGEIAAPAALSLERIAERRSLLAFAAMAAGVRIPRFVAGVPCGPESIVLVYEQVDGTPLEHPTYSQIAELWSSVARLHRNRVTHRGLTASEILLDAEGHVVLPIPKDGAAFASDLRISLDRAQLLITTAQLVGADEAVHVARSVLSDDELAATLPLLQRVVLSRETRAALKRDDPLLESVRGQIQGQIHQEPLELARVERFRPRTIISIVAGLVAGYLIVGQLGSVDLVTVFSAARWQWVPLVLAASAGTYFAAALSLTGYVREKLSFTRTVLAQLAASFAGFVTPPSVGGLAVNIRYLRKANLSTAGAATSVGMSQIVNGVSHVLLLIVFAAATGVSSHKSLPIPSWAFFAVGVLAVLALLVLALPAPRRWALARLLPPLREALPRLLNLLGSPTKLTEAIVGTLLLNVSYIAALWFAVHAFAGGVGFPAVAVVYLAGAAVASVAPTPGGLGAVEVALSTGLAAAGMASAAAISAVLLFRLATFWLPVPFGWAALHLLQRRDAL